MIASPMAQQADRSKIEQIVMQFFAKSLHIVLESRIPFLCSQKKKDSVASSAPSLSTLEQRATKDCWFNLSLGDCPLSVEDLGSVRRIISDSMAIDVLLLDNKAAGVDMRGTTNLPCNQMPEQNSPSRSKTIFSWGAAREKDSTHATLPGVMVERWVLQFDLHNKASAATGSGLKGLPGYRGSSIALANSKRLGVMSVDADFDSGAKPGIFGAYDRKVQDLASAGAIGVQSAQLPKHVVELPALYKRMVIMLRSLYARARLLPAYKLFRLASSSSHSDSFSLSYNVSSPPVPLREADWTGMSQYSFTPVETQYGRLCLSVAYRHTTAFTALEAIPPIVSHIITDYVGSPTTEHSQKFLTDRYGLPESRGSGRQASHVVSLPSSVPSSPSSPSFARRHSWNGAGNKLQALPRLSPSPRSNVNWSPSSSPPIPPHPSTLSKRVYSAQILPSHGSPSHECIPSSMPTYTYSKQKNSQPIDIEGYSSPSFSSSPSLSPPTSSYPKSDGASREFRRSAPLSIPKPSIPCSPKLQAANLHQARSPLLPPPPSPARNSKSVSLLRALSANSRLTGKLLSGSPLDCKLTAPLSTSAESPLHGPSLHIYTLNQVSHDRETGYQDTKAGKNVADCPSFTSLSRGSRKDSGDDDAVEEDFSLPFVSDDDDDDDDAVGQRHRIDSCSSKGNSYQSSGITDQRSQDAAVGFLIRILNKASPLRSFTVDAALDLPALQCQAANSVSIPVVSSNSYEADISGLQPVPGILSAYIRKTATDAMQELQVYKEIRELLATKGKKT